MDKKEDSRSPKTSKEVLISDNQVQKVKIEKGDIEKLKEKLKNKAKSKQQ